MFHVKYRLVRFGFLSVLVCLNFSVVASQTHADDLETVIVSASRTEQVSAHAPSNVFELKSEQLNIVQAEHIQQQLNRVPGVNYQRGNGQESLPGIRSAVLSGAGACANVLIMEDSLPVRGPAFCNVNELFDTHFEQAGQIDVTRGPGTSFYGSNSLTGSINVSLPAGVPSYLALELGDDDYLRLKGAASYGADSSLGSLYLTLTDADSFRDGAGYAQQKVSWRHEQRFANWTVNAGLTAVDLDQNTAGFIIGLDSYKYRNLASQNLDPNAFRKSNSVRTWARFSKGDKDSLIWQVTPYVRATDMKFRLHFLPGDPLERNEQLGVGFQSSLRGQANDNLKWTVGLDADFSEGKLQQTQEKPTQGSAFLRETIPVGVHYDYLVDAEQIGLFGLVDWQVSPNLSLLSGIRFEKLNYDYNNLSLTGRTRDDGTECSFGGCRYSRPADRKDSFFEGSPSVELRYQLTPDWRLHASIASSFRAPQATELYRLQREQKQANLDSVSATNMEFGVGYRSNTIDANVTAFDLRKSNVIFRDSDFFNVDGNRLDSRGLELSLSQQLSESLSWRFAGARSDYTYASDQLSGGVNINGNKVDTAPSLHYNVGLNWQVSSKLFVDVELQHVGPYFLEPENRREYEGYHVLNVRSGYDFSPNLHVSLRLLNAMNDAYAERADFTSFTNERYFPGAPRTVFLGFRYNFTQ